MQYFVVMIDYTTDRAREAVVNPEMTRRDVVALAHEVEASPTKMISFIHEVRAGVLSDITDEILEEIEQPTFDRPNAADRQAWAFDRARDYRKETV